MDTKELVERLRKRIEIATWYEGGLRHVSELNPDGPEAADAIERLERERDEARDVALSDYWEEVIGSTYTPAVIKSVRHIHPEHVRPVFEAHKGTEVADVIAGLIFAKQMASNRAQLMGEAMTRAMSGAEAAESEAATLRARVAKMEEALKWELNILDVEVRPVVKPSKKEWIARRIERLRAALTEEQKP